MDGLDVPFVRELDAGFFEPFAGEQQPLMMPANDSERRYGIGQLCSTCKHAAGPSLPLLNYKWERTEEALRQLAMSGFSPFDPPWARHEHANDTHADAILFSVQDTPILQALGLYREQAHEANDGHQLISREFHQ